MPICQKCQERFPNRIKIDGKSHVIHNRKFCLLCSPFGLHNTCDLTKGPRLHLSIHDLDQNTDTKLCTNCCQELPISKFSIIKRKNNTCGLSCYCKLCSAQMAANKHRSYKIEAVKYKGGRCEDCGFIGYAGVYDFHHLDPTQKDFEISSFKRKKLTDRLKQELDKCAILCANCHRIRHAKERGLL